MSHSFEHRRGSERRRLPRGGRRADDAVGFAPLVLLVGRGESIIAQSEAVLARLKFAVATSATVDEALRVMAGIRPDVVVADPDAASRIRLEASEPVPVVELNGEMRGNPEPLIESIREAIRASAKEGR